MLTIVVILLVPVLVRGIQLGDSSSLHFDVNHEYANSYEDYKPRNYEFKYGVSDPDTGDHKSHWEVQENGVVRGEYRLLEPDGTTRNVQYTADDLHGFRAIVKKIGHAVHPPSHSEISHSSPIIPQIQHAQNEPYYKSYDGSGQNYGNTLPAEVPSLGDPNLSLPLSQTEYRPEETVLQASADNFGPIGDEPSQTLPEVSYSIPYQVPTQHLSQNGITLEGRIRNDPFVPSYIQKPSYMSEITPSASTDYLLPVQEQVHLRSLVPENAVHSLPPIQVQNGVDSERSYLASDQSTSIVDSLLKGIRIDHPHGESSSSFFSKTGNIEDDAVYRSHTGGEMIPDW